MHFIKLQREAHDPLFHNTGMPSMLMCLVNNLIIVLVFWFTYSCVPRSCKHNCRIKKAQKKKSKCRNHCTKHTPKKASRKELSSSKSARRDLTLAGTDKRNKKTPYCIIIFLESACVLVALKLLNKKHYGKTNVLWQRYKIFLNQKLTLVS